MKHGALEGIQEPDGPPVSGKKNELPVIAELESRPLTRAIVLELKGCEGTLRERGLVSKVNEMDDARLYFVVPFHAVCIHNLCACFPHLSPCRRTAGRTASPSPRVCR